MNEHLLPRDRTPTCREALQVLLDNVDFTAGNCRPVDMVGACIPAGLIDTCRRAIAAEEPKA